MSTRILTGGVLAAIAGAAMLAATATSASAFTLSSSSLERPVVGSDVDHVWWDRWGRWHPNVYYRPYYGPRWGYGRRCWRGYYGHLHCAW